MGNLSRSSTYTELTSKIGFQLRRASLASEPACIAQLTEVELLRQRKNWLRFKAPSLPNSQFLKSLQYGVLK
jgi:hypothetical protein